MRRLIFCFAIALAIVGPSIALSPRFAIAAKATSAAQGDLQLFASEAAAQKHCPKDEVVWLNLPSGIYHEKGMRWYGHTKHGAYVCRKEADAAGDRDTRNGQ
jgi:type II secretory pathway pseudopilin PulG